MSPTRARLHRALHHPAALPLALALLALGWRLLRWPLRWNQITLAYAAYHEPFSTALAQGRLIDAAGTFYGLHPPGYSLLVALWQGVVGRPALLLGVSAALSAAAVAAVGALGARLGGRAAGAAAGLLMGTSLYHSHYSLEVNNYPLLVLLLALLHLSFPWLAEGRPRGRMVWVGLAAAGAWVHVLALATVAVQVALVAARRPARVWRRPLTWLALLLSPLLPSILQRVGLGSTYHNEVGGWEGFIEQTVWGMDARFGPSWAAGLLVLAAALGALRGAHRGQGAQIAALALSLTVTAVASVLMILLGVAAAHQHPYFLHCLPPLMVLAGLGLCPPAGVAGEGRAGRPHLALALLCVLPSVVVGAAEIAPAWEVRGRLESTPHALRMALARVATRGDGVIWLIAPPLHPDDDKLSQDLSFELLDPWAMCRWFQPAGFDFEYVNYEYGQPYACEAALKDSAGRWGRAQLRLYTFSDVYPGPMTEAARFHHRRGETIEIVLYDIEASPDYPLRLEALLDDLSEAQGSTITRQGVGATLSYQLVPERR